jgi:hypothetical protein
VCKYCSKRYCRTCPEPLKQIERTGTRAVAAGYVLITCPLNSTFATDPQHVERFGMSHSRVEHFRDDQPVRLRWRRIRRKQRYRFLAVQVLPF